MEEPNGLAEKVACRCSVGSVEEVGGGACLRGRSQQHLAGSVVTNLDEIWVPFLTSQGADKLNFSTFWSVH